MSLENVFSSLFLDSLTADQREALEKLGEEGVRALLNKVLQSNSWMLSQESVTAIVNYDDPRWSSIPTQGGKYGYVVSSDLTPADFLKGDRKGKWAVTFRWLTKPGSCTTTQALEAIKASNLPGANRAEIESVMDAHPRNWWAGFGTPRDSGRVPCVFRLADDGKRDLGLSGPVVKWREGDRFLLACEYRRLDP